MRALLSLLGAGFVVALPGCGGADGSAGPPRPNVVVVLLDTLRQDHLGIYGYERENAPWIARLAERSTVFDNAYAVSSWTAPSTATLFTGLYPPRHGVVLGFFAHEKEPGVEQDLTLECLPDSHATLPELLRDAGYQTYGVASNANIIGARGFGRGFDHFECHQKRDALDLVQPILDWNARRDPERPTFLYLHFNDVHKPYDKRDEWYVPADGGRKKGKAKTAELVARYDSEIGYVDSVLAELAGELGWDENTLIVVLADHGEEFEDHGAFGHRYRLYEELVRVPLIVHVPGTLTGSRSDQLVSQIDVLPTVAELLDIPVSEARDGRSLVSLLDGSDTSFGSRTVFAHRRKPKVPAALWAVVQGRWKLIVDDQKRRTRLFDLDADPAEMHDVAAANPDVVEKLTERLEGFRALEPLETSTLVIEMTEDLRKHLEEMGYAGDDDDEE